MKQIGFKITDNKLAVVEHTLNDHLEQGNINEKEMQRVKALLELAELIDKAMRKQANSIAVNYKFSEMSGKDLIVKMDKFYTKHYETI